MEYLLILFLLFHLSSYLICLLAIRSTFKYLSKHQVRPKLRFLPFGFLRVRHIGLLYLICMSLLTFTSISVGIYFLM